MDKIVVGKDICPRAQYRQIGSEGKQKLILLPDYRIVQIVPQ